MPTDALPIPWDDPRRTEKSSRDRTTERTITGSSRTTTVSPRE